MKAKLLKYGLKQFLCWILLLQMVNISVDPPEIRSAANAFHTLQHTREINEIESIYEFVSEGLLEQDIPEEEDEQDIEKNVKSVLLYCFKPSVHTFEIDKLPLRHQVYYPDHFPLQYTEPLSPPPKNA